MSPYISILVLGGLLGLLSSTIYLFIRYQNIKTEHNLLVSNVEKLENEFLTEIKNITFDELKETEAGIELIRLLQDFEIFPEKLPFETSANKLIDVKSAQDYLNLGNLLFQQKRFEEAEVALRQAIEKNPNYAEAYSNLGVLLAQQNRFEEAEVAYRQAIEKDPNSGIGYYNLAALLNLQERPEEALFALQQSIEKDQISSTKNKGQINLSSLREQAINMQKALQTENIVIEVDNIKVIMNGNQTIESIEISGIPEPNLVNALNTAIYKSQKLAAQKMQELSSRV